MSTTEKPLPKRKNANANVGWVTVRSIVALVLLVAAFSKTHQLATTPVLGDGLLETRWFQILLVECELALVVIQIVGIAPKIAWLVSMILFSIFGLVSLSKALGGAESCGCFGAATINPWVTFVLDIGIVASLIAFRPKHEKICFRLDYRVVVNYLLIIIPLGIFVFWVAGRTNIIQLQEIGQVLEQESVVKLEPQSWLGKEFPLRNHCDVGGELATGSWTVMLHRAGCAECKESCPLIARLAKKRNHSLAVLELVSSQERLAFADVKPLIGLLNQEFLWFVETPVMLELENGVVKQVLLRDDLKRMRFPDSQRPFLFSALVGVEVLR